MGGDGHATSQVRALTLAPTSEWCVQTQLLDLAKILKMQLSLVSVQLLKRTFCLGTLEDGAPKIEFIVLKFWHLKEASKFGA